MCTAMEYDRVPWKDKTFPIPLREPRAASLWAPVPQLKMPHLDKHHQGFDGELHPGESCGYPRNSFCTMWNISHYGPLLLLNIFIDFS